MSIEQQYEIHEQIEQALGANWYESTDIYERGA